MDRITKLFRNPIVLGALAVVVVVALICIDDLLATHLVNFIQMSAKYLVWLLLPAAAFLFTRARTMREQAKLDAGFEAGKDRFSYHKPVAEARYGVLTVATVVAVLGLVGFGFFTSYLEARQYAEHTQVSNKSVPTFGERAPFVVAAAQAPGSLGDLRTDGIEDTSYLPAQDKYSSLATAKGWLSGYAGVLEQDIDLTGQATSSICKFSPKAGDRLDGWFSHSLEREIAHHKIGYRISTTDAYGACIQLDGKTTPVVIVPLKELQGWFPSIEVPAGVAVYNGLTGEVTVRDNVKAGELPGTVFPLSLSERLRDGTGATGSFLDYAFGRVGYSDTSADDSDPNGGNRADFGLATKDGLNPSYVTPLTMQGRAVAVSAIGMVDAGTVTAGELNTYEVRTLPATRKANSAVRDRIKTDYSDLPDWASGLQVFEIAPVSTDTWVASLGQKQNVAYRVLIKANGDSCLQSADGTNIRCGRATAVGGNGPGVALAPTTGSTPVQVPVDGKLSKLTDAELAKLQQQLANEVARRLTSK